jgi:hypothetical protein
VAFTVGAAQANCWYLVLAKMAENVMTHYENMKEKEDRKRVLNMNMCLAAFVDPENQIKKNKRRPDSQTSTVRSRRSSAHGDFLHEPHAQTRHRSRRPSRHRQDSGDGSDATASTQSRRVEDDDNIETFRRASDLLHAAMGLDYGGGVVFMDTATSYRSVSQCSSILKHGFSFRFLS